MKSSKIFLVILIVIFLIGCAAQNKMRYGVYNFSYDGKNYQIESYTPPTGDGNNFLVLKEDGNVLIKAVDKEQNGYIDKVLMGDIPLQKVREIYTVGLKKCSQSGKMETKFSEKNFMSEDMSNKYYLATYTINSDEVYNKFTILKKYDVYRTEELIFIDNSADGILDEVISGMTTTDQYQDVYMNVLKKGIKNGGINRVQDKYLVIATN